MPRRPELEINAFEPKGTPKKKLSAGRIGGANIDIGTVITREIRKRNDKDKSGCDTAHDISIAPVALAANHKPDFGARRFLQTQPLYTLRAGLPPECIDLSDRAAALRKHVPKQKSRSSIVRAAEFSPVGGGWCWAHSHSTLEPVSHPHFPTSTAAFCRSALSHPNDARLRHGSPECSPEARPEHQYDAPAGQIVVVDQRRRYPGSPDPQNAACPVAANVVQGKTGA